jgi:hypothetical protein
MRASEPDGRLFRRPVEIHHRWDVSRRRASALRNDARFIFAETFEWVKLPATIRKSGVAGSSLGAGRR